MNIVDAILYQCKHRPSVAAICCPGTKLDVISYGRLERFINNIGRQALAMGIARGNVVAIMVTDKIFHAAIVLGLTRLGVITVSARHEKLPKELEVDVAKGPGFPFCARVYCDLGLTTAAGLRYLLYMLFKGGTIFFYGEDPVSTIQTFDLYQVQAMIASPYALGEYLKFFEAHGEFHCGFEHISCAGGIVSKTLSERVRARMTPNLVSCYGSTEAGSVACAPAHLIADVPNAVGHGAPWITVEIVDGSGQALRPGHEGVVRIRGPYNVA